MVANVEKRRGAHSTPHPAVMRVPRSMGAPLLVLACAAALTQVARGYTQVQCKACMHFRRRIGQPDGHSPHPARGAAQAAGVARRDDEAGARHRRLPGLLEVPHSSCVHLPHHGDLCVDF